MACVFSTLTTTQLQSSKVEHVFVLLKKYFGGCIALYFVLKFVSYGSNPG